MTERLAIEGLDINKLPTPCYVIDLGRLRRNARILQEVAERSGAKILLALKAYSCYQTFDIFKPVLSGCCASSLDEARLAAEEFGGETHVFCPAYTEANFPEFLEYCSHFSLNSQSQWQRVKRLISTLPGNKEISCGLRINPEHRETDVEMYDPCGQFSRLGITLENLQRIDFNGIEGLHCHNLCEKYAEHFQRTLSVIEQNFARYIKQVKWINFGGGHLITSHGYNIELLIKLLQNFKTKFGIEMYLEPGEAHVRDAGVLVAEVVDTFSNGMDIAILDTSAATHMPDVLEMPYRPEIDNSGEAGQKEYTYRLGGPSCLAGDVIGDYSFDQPLRPGSRLVFRDMAHYTMVKNNTFNGIRLPSILTFDPDNGEVKTLREFSYEDFKSRL